MELQLLLPGDVATTAFRVRPAERFRDICSRIKDEYELPSGALQCGVQSIVTVIIIVIYRSFN